MEKIGAIWARVSTDKQAETSIPTQIDCSKAKADSLGFIIPKDNIISTDRTSLQLNDDPKFLELYDLITKRKINAIFLLDRDRLQAEPLERLSFISLCKENGVQIIPCQGPELLDSDEGQLIEMVLAIGKKKSVLRAQLGSKQGLHDRVTRDKLPITYHKVYGYTWVKPVTLIPNSDSQNVKLIFDLLLQGMGYAHVIKELQRRGIPSPSGQLIWNKAGISQLIHNPIYAGKYYGLKLQVATPKKRKTNSYGKSSEVKKPESEWFYIPEIKIQDPPITWEQRQKILDQVTSHMKLSQRHAKNDYLLRGFITCNEHYGKGGRPRVYHGHPKPDRGIFYYICPVTGCKNRYLPGPAMDEDVKTRVAMLLGRQPDDFYEFLNSKDTIKIKNTIQNDLNSLSNKAAKLVTKQSRLEDDRYSEKISLDVYKNLKEKYEFEANGIEKRQNELLDQLAQVNKQREVIESFTELQRKFSARLMLNHDDVSNEEWREIFTSINLEITPTSEEERAAIIHGLYSFEWGTILDEKEYRQRLGDRTFCGAWDVRIKVNIPINSPKLQETLKSIGLAGRGVSKPNKTTYPIYLQPQIIAEEGMKV